MPKLDPKDILYLILVRSEKFSLLPELYEIFGEDSLYKFLEIYGGETIKVPSVKELQKAQRDIDIYLRLRSSRGRESKKDVVSELAETHGITEEKVRSVYKNVRKLVRDLEEARGHLINAASSVKFR